MNGWTDEWMDGLDGWNGYSLLDGVQVWMGEWR